MAIGFPVKADYTTGDVLSAANMNDLSGTLNYLDPTAKGDLFPASSATALGLLAVGANDTVLTADSAEPTGMKWAAAGGGGGGKVLQVVSATTSTAVSISTVTFTDSGITASITPLFSTSKILVLITAQSKIARNQSGINYVNSSFKLLRGATVILDNSETLHSQYYSNQTEFNQAMTRAIHFYDSPATTSATTYKLQGNVSSSLGTLQFQSDSASTSSIILMEIGA
jgi:hypothetical protein